MRALVVLFVRVRNLEALLRVLMPDAERRGRTPDVGLGGAPAPQAGVEAQPDRRAWQTDRYTRDTQR